VATVSCGEKTERFQFVADHGDKYGIRYLCSRLGVSRSGYYVYANRKKPEREKQDEALLVEIERIYKSSKETYGSPRVHRALRKKDIRVGRKRVERLMRDNGIKSRAVRVYKQIPGLYKASRKHRNLRIKLPRPTAVNQHWVGDITYLRIGSRFMYVAVVMDLYSRRIVGWSMGKHKDSKLTTSAMRMAIRNRQPQTGLLFHTDRGSEYCCHKMQNLHKRMGFKPSMNRPGRCTDNAEMESFFHSFKTDVIAGKRFRNEPELRHTVRGYMSYFYNQTRLHSTLDYNSPAEYEMMTG
jgi:transposase InsO family protein